MDCSGAYLFIIRVLTAEAKMDYLHNVDDTSTFTSLNEDSRKSQITKCGSEKIINDRQKTT